MNSFFDVFKWDRFVAPSAMELLFWLVSAIAVLFGVWGLVSGLAMVGENALPGLILIAISIIGTLVGIIAARVACEAIVILFRVNENLMDIAERSLAPQIPAMSENDTARLDRRVAEARERAAARAEAAPERPAIDHRPVELQPTETESEARDPFAPDQGRVEPKAWDVRPTQPRANEAKPPEPKPVVEIEAVEPPVRMRETAAESRAAERRSPPIITVPDRSEPKTPPREIPGRPAGRTEPPIEHALKRLSEPSSSEAMRASLAEGLESQLSERRTRPSDVAPLPAEPRRPAVAMPVDTGDVTALPAFIATRESDQSETDDAPIALSSGLPKEKARRRNGHATEVNGAVTDAAPVVVPPEKAAVADHAGPILRAPAAKASESEREKPQGQPPQKTAAAKNRGNTRHPAKGGQTPLKRRRPRPDQDRG
ncbi:protein of unknown function [Kaistia soli DSM 19436]|uniref:DUF4282 domain-containing protein n=1 Tax=Kaistia soli DSM 19436 TaxID=1122133 RepID=A0A1M4ZAF2_9HYPH|nr:DUF4282 domain-containing protein [Kaistia soli]SHF15049.1 protein of unknown function [Kaistia soli DSM 19436]